jgi:hypothetical protein
VGDGALQAILAWETRVIALWLLAISKKLKILCVFIRVVT